MTIVNLRWVGKRERKLLLIRTVGVAVVLTFVWVTLIFFFCRSAKQALWDEVREHLMTIAYAAAMSIDPELHEKVYHGSESSKLYKQMRNKLTELSKELLPEVRAKGLELAMESIYTLKPSSGNIWHFVLDSGVPYDIDGNGKIDPREDIAHLREPYDVSPYPELRRCYIEGRPTADKELTVDKWGVWLSGYAPLKDRQGKVAAIVGVDMNMSTILAKEGKLRNSAAIIFACLMVLTLLGAVMYLRMMVAYELVRYSEQIQKQLADVSADLIYGFKPDTTIIYVSPKVRVYGYSPEGVIGRSALEFIPKEYHEQVLERIEELRRGEPYSSLMHPIITADGELRYGECRGFAIRDSDGKLSAIYGTFRDLTDLVRLTQELRDMFDAVERARADWEAAFNAIDVGIAVLDGSFKVVAVNKALSEMLKVEPRKIVGRGCWEVIHPETDRVNGCPYSEALMRGEHVKCEACIDYGRTVIITSYAQIEDGNPRRFIHCYTDVTSQRAMEELVRRTERLVSLGQIAAGIAHEVNNPLSVILSTAEFLSENVEDAHHKEMLAQISDMAKRISRITHGLLSIARPKPEELQLIDLNKLIKEAIGMRMSSLCGSNIKVVLELHGQLPKVKGDEAQLKQVLLALISNAEGSMAESGGGTLTITSQAQNDYVVIHVDDTGSGILDEFLPHIFDPFFSTKPKGVGLDLAVVHSIITAHGGRVWAQNLPKGGARFTIELPVADSTDEGFKD
ncbi:MAG: PAS domain S-box protein [Armatimonadota bacterium]|nr:PAS domain S-box protein [Armatimonadota bacterium]MDW8025227.1 PAS domain S-box protein [Armatimonadota bacterium]